MMFLGSDISPYSCKHNTVFAQTSVPTCVSINPKTVKACAAQHADFLHQTSDVYEGTSSLCWTLLASLALLKSQ